MLRILPTKEIKVFHSSSQVGLAYIVRTPLKRKSRIFFREVTLVVEFGMTSQFHVKSRFWGRECPGSAGKYGSQYKNTLSFPSSRSAIGGKRAQVKGIARIAGPLK
jgi:hypothetical protein